MIERPIIYPTIGPAPCETCPLEQACSVSELACPEFYRWAAAGGNSRAKTRIENMTPGRPTKYIYDMMMSDKPRRMGAV